MDGERQMLKIEAPNLRYEMCLYRGIVFLSTMLEPDIMEYVKSRLLHKQNLTLSSTALIKKIRKIKHNMMERRTSTLQILLPSVIPTDKYIVYVFTWLEYTKVLEGLVEGENVKVTLLPTGEENHVQN